MNQGSLVMLVALLASATVEAQSDNAGGSPCLDKLKTAGNAADADPSEKKKKEPKEPSWFSKNAEKVLGTVGTVGGAVLGKSVCKKEDQAKCMALGALGGALLGSQLGKALSEADKKRYQEATYKVALTGRPQSLVTETGCVVVEPKSEELIEERQIELALGPGVTAPRKLRTIAEAYVRPTPVVVTAGPNATSGTEVGANVPSFVMGSTNSGRYLLLGREDPNQGFVGAGYVKADGWVASPDSSPAQLQAASGEPQLVKIGVEVPCRKISSSIRVESSNKTETFPGKVCRLPNGISESV
jgi:hypothetical protein